MPKRAGSIPTTDTFSDFFLSFFSSIFFFELGQRLDRIRVYVRIIVTITDCRSFSIFYYLTAACQIVTAYYYSGYQW